MAASVNTISPALSIERMANLLGYIN